MQSLLIKRALDAVNEELTRPSAADDPRADAEYNHPFASKGTELDNPKYGSADGPTLGQLALASVSHLRQLASSVDDPQRRSALIAHCRRVVKAAQVANTASPLWVVKEGDRVVSEPSNRYMCLQWLRKKQNAFSTDDIDFTGFEIVPVANPRDPAPGRDEQNGYFRGDDGTFHDHDMSLKVHHKNCRCARCAPLTRPCDCPHCRDFRVSQGKRAKKAGTEDSRFLAITTSRLERICHKLKEHPEVQEQVEKLLDCDFDAIADALHYLKHIPQGTVTKDPEEERFTNMKRAEVEIHEEPPIGAPRPDQRRHLDSDIKDATDASVNEEPEVELYTPKHALLQPKKSR